MPPRAGPGRVLRSSAPGAGLGHSFRTAVRTLDARLGARRATGR
ncbi:hypothetical protein [Streptomyces erythrochromogenes]|nr:hypothetical protein OG489_06420 [Streptomyces erythrochromogenes]